MTDLDKSDFLSSYEEVKSSQNSLNESHNHSQEKNNSKDNNNRLDHLHLRSPATHINLTAQQYFNNQTVNMHQFSGLNNLTYEERDSKNSLERRPEKESLTPGIQSQFSQMDNFLKEIYQKFGILDLIASFVNMEQQMINVFKYVKKIQNQSQITQNSKRKVSCFEQANQIDEFSFEALQAKENIIHEFLWSVNNFLNAENDAQLVQDKIKDTNVNFSFSENKPHMNKSIRTGIKANQIHSSRSRHIAQGLKTKKYMFSDEKMIQSINLNKPVTPIRYQNYSVNKITEMSFKNTNSYIMDEESMESQNIQIRESEQFLKTIFKLRQQNVALKMLMDKYRAYDQKQSEPAENFQKQDTYLLDSSEQSIKGIGQKVKKIKNCKNFQFDHMKVLESLTAPLIVDKDTFDGFTQQNYKNNSKTKSILRSETKQILILQNFKGEIYKQNNQNFSNVQKKTKTQKLENCLDDQKIKDDYKMMIKNTVLSAMIENSHIEESAVVNNTKSELHSNKNQQIHEARIEMGILVNDFTRKFKAIFQADVQIQLILLQQVLNKNWSFRFEEKEIFQNLINWYQNLKIDGTSNRQRSEKFIHECLDKKKQILNALRQLTPSK